MKIPLRQLLLIVAYLQLSCEGLENGLARTPPMGWMTWQRFRCQTDCKTYPDDCISKKLIQRTVDKLVSDGYKAAGYRYVITDDCWPEFERHYTTHELQADHKRFPEGIADVGKYIHKNGLLFGIYLDYGKKTCEGFPGSMDYLQTDAISLADWEVDYVKVDGCYSDPKVQPKGYEQFGQYMNHTGRPIVYSCSYPAYINWQANHSVFDWERLRKNCNLWRMLADVQDGWTSVLSILNSYKEHSDILVESAGPGSWNDPDMLILGNYGLSRDEEKVQMGMWCMLAAPLLISADLDQMNDFSKQLLLNPMLLAIDQDVGGQQASYMKTIAGVQIWFRKLGQRQNTWAVAFLYLLQGGGPTYFEIKLEDVHTDFKPTSFYTLTDVFTKEVFGMVRGDELFSEHINPSGIAMFHVELHESKSVLIEFILAALI